MRKREKTHLALDTHTILRMNGQLPDAPKRILIRYHMIYYIDLALRVLPQVDRRKCMCTRALAWPQVEVLWPTKLRPFRYNQKKRRTMTHLQHQISDPLISTRHHPSQRNNRFDLTLSLPVARHSKHAFAFEYACTVFLLPITYRTRSALSMNASWMGGTSVGEEVEQFR